MVRFAPRAGRVISIHAPQWGATGSWNTGNFGTLPISIHTPQWGATTTSSSATAAPRRFQSTHPSGVRLDPACVAGSFHFISIHAPQWGATWSARPKRRVCESFQSTHPSGVRRSGLRGRGGFVEISIHAPQWGATSWRGDFTDAMTFQSTHPSGVRPVGQHVADACGNISIHAPHWGATASRRCRPRRTLNFNPRTPVGCDAQWSFGRRLQVLFQSTHPSGVRRPAFAIMRRTLIFQSTHPSGVRL